MKSGSRKRQLNRVRADVARALDRERKTKMETNLRMKSVTVTAMNDQCISLVHSLGVLWVRVKGMPIDGACVVSFEEFAIRQPGYSGRRPSSGRVMITCPVTDEQTYVIVLHELGHVAHPKGRTFTVSLFGGELISKHRKKYQRMVAETAAWEWAYEQALCWTPAMEQVRTTCFSSYENRKV